MKYLLILLIITCPFFSKAQFEMGSQQIGGDGMIDYFTSGKTIIEEGIINLGYGYFVDNHLMIGATLGIDYAKDAYSSNYNYATRYSTGLNVRRYLPIGEGKYGFFVQGQWVYDLIKSGYRNSTGPNSFGDVTDYRLIASPGAFLFLDEANAFEFMFSSFYFLSGLNYSYKIYGINTSAASFLIGYHHYFNYPKKEAKLPTKMMRAN